MPNRVIRDWTTSERMDTLSLGAEVFFTRLIMKADDYGSFHANPKLLRAALFPLKNYSDKQIAGWFNECWTAGLIDKYEAENREYLRIKDFGQRLRQMRNTFPQPADDSLTSGGQHAVNGRPETKRNEEEEETETKRGEISLSDYIDLLNKQEEWVEEMQMIHKGKDIPQAIKSSYAHLKNKKRLERGELSDFKGCVQSFLNNEKPGNGMKSELSLGERKAQERKAKGL